MKTYFAFVIFAALGCFALNASAHSSFVGQDACDVKYHLHENLASVLTNPNGVTTLNESWQSVRNICMDEKAHGPVISMIDALTDISTNENVSQTLGKSFGWARKVMKDAKFRVVWLENMKGVNMLFDNQKVLAQLMETVFKNLRKILRSDSFDDNFPAVVKSLAPMLKFKRNMYSGAGKIFSGNNKNLARSKSSGRSRSDDRTPNSKNERSIFTKSYDSRRV